MKGPADYGGDLARNPLIFSRRMALFVEKTTEPTLNSLKIKENEFWSYQVISSPCDTFDLKSEERPPLAPSRAWHKIQEASVFFDWKLQKDQIVIEIGSAPGGISYFLIQKGVKLFAIDPAEMDPGIKGFKHIKESVFDVQKRDLPKHCDWIVSDLNLKGELNLEQSKRIADFYPMLKGGFLTIKTPKEFDVKHMKKWSDVFKDFETSLVHLPAHRKEIGLFFKRI